MTGMVESIRWVNYMRVLNRIHVKAPIMAALPSLDSMAVSSVEFTLRVFPKERIMFYECECGHGSIPSIEFEHYTIPEEVLDAMRVHVELDHVM